MSKLDRRKGEACAAGVRTALITGASGGIGEELCREFARHGYRLVITARSREKLELLATRLRRSYSVEVEVLPADLTRREAPEQLYRAVEGLGLQIDVLVNNAGFGYGGYFFQNRPGLQERMLQLGVMAPTRLCRLFLPQMLARGRGRILNLCSTGSFIGGPMNSVYCAGKAYLLHLSEALSEELAGTGVAVTALCPGGTHTGFARNANMGTTRLFHFGVLQADYVAREGYCALAQGRRIAVVGPLNQLMIGCMRLVPRIAAVRVSKFLQEPYVMKDCRYGKQA